jgi:hypothetical protein
MSGSWKAEEFPNLKDSDFIQTSDASEEYNCISYAVGDTSRRWDPDDMHQYYWPANAPRNDTMLALVMAMQTVGFEPCLDFSAEDGFEKIALYALHGKATHVALQLMNGSCTSKLGDYEDIEHKTLECLNGEGTDFYGRPMCYGRPEFYMRRQLGKSNHPPES